MIIKKKKVERENKKPFDLSICPYTHLKFYPSCTSLQVGVLSPRVQLVGSKEIVHPL